MVRFIYLKPIRLVCSCQSGKNSRQKTFLTQSALFNTPVFRSLADRVDAIDADALNAQIKRDDYGMEYNPVSLLRVNQAYHDLECMGYYPDEKPLLLSVIQGGEPHVAADVRLFIVNPASSRSEAPATER
jgi:hypothetical protein